MKGGKNTHSQDFREGKREKTSERIFANRPFLMKKEN
jgi:hypothetical protein